MNGYEDMVTNAIQILIFKKYQLLLVNSLIIPNE